MHRLRTDPSWTGVANVRHNFFVFVFFFVLLILLPLLRSFLSSSESWNSHPANTPSYVPTAIISPESVIKEEDDDDDDDDDVAIVVD